MAIFQCFERLHQLRSQRGPTRGQTGQSVHQEGVKAAGVQQAHSERSFRGISAEDQFAQARMLSQIERGLAGWQRPQ